MTSFLRGKLGSRHRLGYVGLNLVLLFFGVLFVLWVGGLSIYDKILGGLVDACRDLSREFGEDFYGLILFGSFARREAGEYSDVDVFVVFREVGGLGFRGKVYRIISRSVNRDVTLVCMSLDRLLDPGLRLTPLLINVVADAVVVCDPKGVLAGFVEKGRRLIEKAGLVRYRTPDGKYGWRPAGGGRLRYVEVP